MGRVRAPDGSCVSLSGRETGLDLHARFGRPRSTLVKTEPSTGMSTVVLKEADFHIMEDGCTFEVMEAFEGGK